MLDLALLKISAKPTTYATFRSTAPLQIGESVTAAGFPLKGLLASGPIVSTGIVNALGGVKNDPTRVQISAQVQPGNSGGPLVDANGSVVGIVVAQLDVLRLAAITGI
jgi:S1-C subfamily serine protease